MSPWIVSRTCGSWNKIVSITGPYSFGQLHRALHSIESKLVIYKVESSIHYFCFFPTSASQNVKLHFSSTAVGSYVASSHLVERLPAKYLVKSSSILHR
jgi:hypothetical protein